MIAKLKDEMKKQGDNCSRVMARLKAQRDSWFISSKLGVGIQGGGPVKLTCTFES